MSSAPIEPVLVDADHRLASGVDTRLGAGRGLLDAQLRDPGLDRLRHPAGGLDLLDVRPGLAGQLVGEPLDVGAAAPRVDGARGARLLLQQQLGVAGDAGGEVGRQRERLVERVRVQRLGVALGRGHRLQAGAHDVVEDVLRGQRPPRGLRMCPQRKGFRVLRAEAVDQLGPQQPGRAHLRDLHEDVHADAPRRTTAAARKSRRPGRNRARPAGIRRRPPACTRAPDRPSLRPPGCGSRRSRSS